jgi:L-seryl-tRNA(Ser) seleniumtransferase
LRLYRDPERLAERLPTLRHIARPLAEIRAQAERLTAPVANAVGANFGVEIIACDSQVGSGALPQETIASAGLAIRPGSQSGRALAGLAKTFRELPTPVIGRVADGALIVDLRCLDDEAGFVETLTTIRAA